MKKAIFSVALLLGIIGHDHASAQVSVAVKASTPVYCPRPARLVVAAPPPPCHVVVVKPAPVVVVRPRRVVVAPLPVCVVAKPPRRVIIYR